MKLNNLNTLLEEGALKRAAAAALFVYAALTSSDNADINGNNARLSVPNQITTASSRDAIRQMSKREKIKFLVDKVAEKYKVKPKLIEKIVSSAERHSYPDFPTTSDILGVIGVESSFNPKSVSNLGSDPAIGLTQIRPAVNGLSRAELSSVDAQVKVCVGMLRQLYVKTGDKDAALHAYNVGLGNHKKSLDDPTKGNPRYAPKVNAEADRYKIPE
jgi:soluble lytic murein transglycosylase-like protein